ncbi:hypothetical protein LEP1GSC130_0720 [Leptospira santarosai str. 200403458]|nr:hypothetical protein LEP1GSC130_0720 [Leptospira santarosai str. 200403458]
MVPFLYVPIIRWGASIKSKDNNLKIKFSYKIAVCDRDYQMKIHFIEVP